MRISTTKMFCAQVGRNLHLPLFCFCLSYQNYKEEVASEMAQSVYHGPKHNSGLD